MPCIAINIRIIAFIQTIIPHAIQLGSGFAAVKKQRSYML
jgi:hypothetical protein